MYGFNIYYDAAHDDEVSQWVETSLTAERKVAGSIPEAGLILSVLKITEK